MKWTGWPNATLAKCNPGQMQPWPNATLAQGALVLQVSSVSLRDPSVLEVHHPKDACLLPVAAQFGTVYGY